MDGSAEGCQKLRRCCFEDACGVLAHGSLSPAECSVASRFQLDRPAGCALLAVELPQCGGCIEGGEIGGFVSNNKMR